MKKLKNLYSDIQNFVYILLFMCKLSNQLFDFS